jgi:RNase adaptor protein for sRNA GlmZ degradation
MMGRVKQLFNEYWEEKLAKMETHQRQLELDLAQDNLNAEMWAQHEKDFNAWLDAYEKSFGDKEGKLP